MGAWSAYAVFVGVAIDPLLAESDAALMKAFTQHIKMYNKTYEKQELATRYHTFCANAGYVTRHNRNADHNTYTLSLNRFADQSFEEFYAARSGHRPAQAVEFQRHHARPQLSFDAPTSVDWTSRGVVTPVKDQGGCGACWAFSATGALEAGNVLFGNRSLVALSEQELLDCGTSAHSLNGCQGGNMPGAFAVAQERGLCSEAEWPYMGRQNTCPSTSPCAQSTALAQVTGSVGLPPNDETQLLAAVAARPVSVAIDAGMQVFQFYSGGVLTSAKCGSRLDHAVLIVGYGVWQSSHGDVVPYWKVKNSWGADWGVGGYVLVERGKNVCGIAAQATYPTFLYTIVLYSQIVSFPE